MCILLTPVLYFITTVIIEVYVQCFTESVSLRDIGKPTSRVELSSPCSLYLKAVKEAHPGSALTGATSELTNSYRKKNSHKTPFSLLRKTLTTKLHSFLLFIYLKFKKKGEHNSNKTKLLNCKHRNKQNGSSLWRNLRSCTETYGGITTSRSYTKEQTPNTQQFAKLNKLLNTAKQLKCHNFAVEQQPLLSLPEKASQVSRTAFLSFS